MNDLDVVLTTENCNIHLFADDTTALVIAPTLDNLEDEMIYALISINEKPTNWF